MSNLVTRYAIAAVVSAVTGGLSFTASAAAGDARPPHRCVPLQQIDETPVVDDQTILIKTKDGNYKRMDLVAKCSGLKMRSGFAHRTWSNDICSSDTLRVTEPSGATCMIEQIVDIDKDEAKKLLAQK